jgi:hypothetical protein
MFSIKTLVRKLTRNYIFADMAQSIGQTPLPNQGANRPTVQPAQPTGLGTAFKGRIEEAIMSEMTAYLRKATTKGWDSEEIDFNMNPLWKNRYYNLWEQALRNFQSQVPPPQQPGVPGQQPSAVRMQYKDIDPTVLLPQIEKHIRSTGKLLTPEELPVAIRENERNLENYYDLGSRVLRQMEDEQATQKTKAPGQVSPQAAFNNKFAQVFYQCYLSPEAENAEQFHLMFQGKMSERFGPQNASDIAAIDDVFNKRIPEGHAGGKTYDPIVGYFVSDLGKHNAGMFIKAFKKSMGEGVKIDRTSLAKFIATRGMAKAEQKFEELMYLQDESVAKYIAEKTRMKGEGAARSGAMIDRETGGVRDMAQDQNYSEQNRQTEDKPTNEVATNALRQGLLDIPTHVAGLGSNLAQKLRDKAQSMQGSSRKQSLERSALLIETYTEAMQKSLSSLFTQLEKGEIDNEDLDTMIKQNLIKVDTDQGVVKIKPNAARSQGDILKHLDFDQIVQPSKLVSQFKDSLVSRVGPEIASSMLGRKNQPLDLSLIDVTSPNYNEKEFQDLKKRIYMMPQFLLKDIGPDIMELMRGGQIDSSTAIALTKMMKPHGQSDKMGRLMSQPDPLDEARDWISKYIPRPRMQTVRDPSGAKSQVYEKNPDGTFVYTNDGSWLSKAMRENEKFPRIDDNLLRSMSDDEFKAWLSKASRYLYNSPGYDDDSKRQTAYYFAQLLDWGRKEYPSWDDHHKDYSDQTKMAYRIMQDALIKMANILDLRKSLQKYASTDHLDESLSSIYQDAIRRIELLWMN